MTALAELGLGVVEALAAGGTGRVVGVYRKAAYLRVPGGLIALTTREAPAGPLHLRADVEPARLRVGDRVVVTPSWLEVGPVLVDLRGATTWRGELPPPGLLRGIGPLRYHFRELNAVRRGDLAGLAAQLGGRGPGLTPEGDDVLAGILIAAYVRWGHVDESVVAHARTNDVSVAYLRWAARGQSIQPVHDYVTGAGPLEAVLAYGHTSGAALAAGLCAALIHLPSRTGPPANGRLRPARASRPAHG
ncbi:MAG: DUF2877 domain-containing protein [Acidimicrobiales bacterium]